VPTAVRRASDPAASLLRACSASARVNQFLVERLHPEVWRQRPRSGPAAGAKTIASIVAHLHNCGLRYLERTEPGAAVPKPLDRHRVTQREAVRSLGAKRRAVLAVVGAALRESRPIVGFPHDAATYLAYYLGHDHHHRGQIALLARLLGHPIDEDTMAGMWQWTARAAE
jgi:uncharacterized damage-inducible protein DinB